MKLSTIISTGLLSLATLTSIQPQVANGGFLPNPRGPPRNDHAHAHPHQNHHQHPVAVRQAQLPKKMDQVETVVPSAVVFHDTNVTTTTNTPPNFNSTTNPIVNGTGGGGGGGSGGAAWPQKPQNITACTAPVYEDTSPLRTHIIRDDCHDLARKVLARAGYWEMAQWTTGAAGGNDGQYVGLVSKGTCQFAVSRRLDMKLLHDQGQGGAHYGNFSSVAAGGAVNNNNNTDVALYVFFPFIYLPLSS